MRYQTVLFDVDNTLLDYRQAEAYALESAWRKRGYDYTPKVLETYREINDALWIALEKGEITKQELMAARFQSVFEALSMKEGWKGFNDLYIAGLAETAFPLDGALETVRTLHEMGVTLAVASNGIAWAQRKRMENAGLLPYFHKVYVSEAIGAAKPRAAFFAHAWEDLGRPDKKTVLMVGDSVAADIEGAKRFGFDTAWIYRDGLDVPETADYVVKKLDEVVKIVSESA